MTEVNPNAKEVTWFYSSDPEYNISTVLRVGRPKSMLIWNESINQLVMKPYSNRHIKRLHRLRPRVVSNN
jgi:hypothetical protein